MGAHAVRGWLVGILAMLSLLLIVSPVRAHAELDSSDPSDGASLTSAPDVLSFTFGEQVLEQGNAVTLTDVASGSRLEVGPVQVEGDMVSVFPELGNPKIDYAWAGLMGYARHFMPLIGSDGQGQWWATAFGGHGMNTTAMGGILMARAIGAKDDEYRRFAPYAPQWAGGPFGRVGVQAGYWYMQLKDVIDERRYGKAA